MATRQFGMKALWDTELDADDATQQEELGAIRIEVEEDVATPLGFKKYRYIKLAAASAAVANGTVVVYSDLYQRVGDTRIAQAARNQVLGVGIGTITAGQYGWVQIGGYHAAVKTNGDDDIADGDVLIHSGADGTVDSVTAGTAPTYIPVGVAVAADVDAANTVAAHLCIPE